jgi:hypothetical protein
MEKRSLVYYNAFDIPSHYGMRTQTHKIVHYDKPDQWEVFDLVSDPSELKNLANDPKHKELFENLRAELLALKQHYGDTSDKTAKHIPQKTPRPVRKKPQPLNKRKRPAILETPKKSKPKKNPSMG